VRGITVARDISKGDTPDGVRIAAGAHQVGRIGCVVSAAFSTLLSQRSLTIMAAQASSLVFRPAGIVPEKATPHLGTVGQLFHASSSRLVDLCFGRIRQWAFRGNLTWGHLSMRCG
jgi:hypothetical protein